MNKKNVRSFLKAVECNEISNVESMLKNDPDLIHVKDRKKNTLLFFANSDEMVELLLGSGADIQSKNHYGRTPLHRFVCMEKFKRAIELLLEKGADINVKDCRDSSPLHDAVNYGYPDIVELLLYHGADVNAIDGYGFTPLFSIIDEVYDGNSWDRVAKLLVKNGARINDINEAVGVGDISIIESFIEADPESVNFKDSYGYTPLHFAIYHERLNIAEFLIGRNADINTRYKGGGTFLHYTVKNGYLEAVEFLISKGADVNVRANDGDTPLALAMKSKQEEIAELLRRHGGRE